MAGPMKGGPGARRAVQKPQNLKKTVARIFDYLKPFRGRLVIVAICVVVGAIGTVAGSYFLKPIINDLIDSSRTVAERFESFTLSLAMMAGVYLVSSVANFIYSRIMLTVSTQTLSNIRKDMFSHMQKLPIKYFDRRTHGELMSLYTNDTDALRDFLSNSLVNLFSTGLSVIGVFIMMWVLSWQMTLTVIVMLGLMFFLIGLIGGRSGKYFKMQQEKISKVNGYIEEMISGQKVVKVFCYEDESKAAFDELNNELCEASTNANTYANVLMPVMGNLSYIHYAIASVVGSVLAIAGIIDVGTIGAFLTYSKGFFRPITQMSQQVNSVMMALAGAERIFNLIDEEPEVDDGYVTLVNARVDAKGNITETEERTGTWAWKHPHHTGEITYTLLRGEVEFEDVVFGYEEDEPVLRGITLYAREGQKIALVGSTGAGKTTITNLINRFYDVPDGKIRYDGINITKIKKDDLRRSLAMVLQDTHLFTGTVMENIRYGKLDASDDECIAAARLANADAFIRHLPQGYDTMLTADGANLSQGQRQLLAIARAAVADPPVLILDEATSSIDTRTEALIEKGMDKLMNGRTVFVIAHRLSTVRNSNAIMVLERGEIIERGDHDDLIAQRGKYFQLYTGMFELS